MFLLALLLIPGLALSARFGPAAAVVSLLAVAAVATWLLTRKPPADDMPLADATADERARAVVATVTEGIVTIDYRGTIESVNGAAERLFGYAGAELLGRNVSMLMPEPYCSEHDSYLARYLQSGEARIIGIGREVLGRRKDGTTFPIDLSVGEGSNHGERFFVAIIRDITERKEMQRKLSQAERLAAVGELAAGIAHEVNNPINTMINCAQLILDGDDPKANATVVQEEGERIASIVKDLLQFARNDDSHPVPTSIQEVVDRTLRLISENLLHHGIRLEVHVADGLPAVRSRPQQLQQVLLNLLINAKDALQGLPPERSRSIRIAAAADPRGVTLSVADTGCGVPTHLRDRIFEPFVTTKRARGGTGLGLSISRSIVESYGGSLTLESDGATGTVFRAWLPVHPDAGR